MSKRKASSDASQGAAKRPAVDDDESSDSDSQMDQSQRPDFQTELVRHTSRKFCQTVEIIS